ncbi:uncharacterized protein LOC128955513 [Oppia nitens]|uniref:uncharacterized protein LOC128955513 n=1 Tax=Oppia nitens TaxID=1686743 RepID=UPI0023DC747F|nr:uncharacterized protein LOC128955513 [Oppia nitens]
MNAKLIYTDKQRERRKCLVQRNKQKSLTINDSTGSSSIASHTENVGYFDINNSNINNSDNQLQIANITSSTGSYCQSVNNNNNNNREDTPIMAINRPITDYSNTFTEFETSIYGELMDALKLVEKFPYIINECIVDYYDQYLRVVVGRGDGQIRSFVQMAKQLAGFRLLTESDQLILLKYGQYESEMLRWFPYFDFERQSWQMSFSDTTYWVKLDVFRETPNNIYDYKRDFLQYLALEWLSDQLIIDLLTTILLFDANRPKLCDTTLIKQQQQIYVRLLMRYLLMKFKSPMLATPKMGRLLKSLDLLNIINQRRTPFYRNYHHTRSTLLQEIFTRD